MDDEQRRDAAAITLDFLIEAALGECDHVQLLDLEICARVDMPPFEWMYANPRVLALFTEPGVRMSQVMRDRVTHAVAAQLGGAR